MLIIGMEEVGHHLKALNFSRMVAYSILVIRQLVSYTRLHCVMRQFISININGFALRSQMALGRYAVLTRSFLRRPPKIYVRLEEADFANLVAGRAVEISPKDGGPTIKIILADIGWGRMVDCIRKAMTE